jgi:RNA polymerase sigma factor for flagellar operon FliA
MPSDDTLAAEEEADLWAAWSRTRDPVARNAIVERHRGTAIGIARSVLRERGFPADIDLDDLRQQAILELTAAVDRFDPTLGVPFARFVQKRIRGSLQDSIASSSELHAQTEWRRSLTEERTRSLRETVPAGLSPLERIAEVAVGLAVGIMLEGTGMHATDDQAVEKIDPYAESMDYAVLTKRIRAAARRLGEPDQFVIRAHYEAEYTFAEVADRLKLSTGRVSQIHSRGLKSIRAMLAGESLDRRV